MIPSDMGAGLAEPSVYQRGLVIDSQPNLEQSTGAISISKGIGD